MIKIKIISCSRNIYGCVSLVLCKIYIGFFHRIFSILITVQFCAVSVRGAVNGNGPL